MTEPIHIEVRSPKGGAGCSTIACLLALGLSNRNDDTILVAVHDDDPYHILGIPFDGSSAEDVNDHLFITKREEQGGAPSPATRYVVWDLGNSKLPPFSPDVRTLWVLRNDYLSYRALAQDVTVDRARDMYFVIEEPARAMGITDLVPLIGDVKQLRGVPLDPGVARATDAGLLLGRVPYDIANRLIDMVDHTNTEVA